MSSTASEPAAPAIPVVGLGASAGGLEALQRLFERLPGDLGAAYVVIVHLAPDHHSELPAILAHHTDMPVIQVADHEQSHLEPDHVYVIAPGRKLEITDSSVGASRFEQPHGQRAAIDLFFRSLAVARGPIFAVILSGGGTDGAVGSKSVKEAGGLVLVQDPREAAHASMPRATIAAETADLVLPIAELADRLAELIRHGSRVPQKLGLEQDQPHDEHEEAVLRKVLDLLRRRTGHDFAGYKRNTILRRLARRLQLNHSISLYAYLQYLDENMEEVRALFSDLLITVTTFFRDPEAWTELCERVVAPLLAQTDPAQAIRCWVPGCATGEEAYTLAILFNEEMARTNNRRELTIFASDVNEQALAIAREATYPGSIAADVSDARLTRWFIHSDHHYQVVREIRDQVVFAAHSLQRDPPFSRLHLISCRNLLIYLEHDLQEQVMAIFRYASRDDGYLFLGSAESAGPELFDPIHATHRIYRVRADTSDRRALPPGLSLGLPRTPALRTSRRASSDREGPIHTHQVMLETQAPPSVVVDGQWNVKTLSETAGRFFEPRGGRATHSITETVRTELRGELVVALRHAFESGQQWLSQFVRVQFNGTPRRVGVLVQPRGDPEESAKEALVTFLEAGPIRPEQAAADARPDNERERELLEKLHQAEQHIDHLRGEHHTSEEDLRAVNEELQSLNEEYRSTAEELETSKEELQSINEELQTMNVELKAKLEEISHANDDLENLMTATDIPTLFLDRQLRIKRFTPQLGRIFSVRLADLGRFIGDITHNLRYESLEIDARSVLDRLIPIELDIESRHGETFIIRLRPYRTTEDRIDGVVITFVDVTTLKRAEDDIRLSERRFRALLEASSDVLYIMNPDWTETRELEGDGFLADVHRPIQEWMDEYVLPDDQPRVAESIQDALRERGPFEIEHRVRRADGSIGWTHSRAVPIADATDGIREWFGAATDVTSRKNAEQALEESDRSKDEFLAVLSHELRNPLAPLRTGVELLKRAHDQPDVVASVRSMMARQLTHLVRLVDDLLDISRISRGQIQLQRSPMDLNDAVRTAVEQIRPTVEARRHEFLVELTSTPLPVSGDLERLTEVAANLLSNAVKYTDPGGVISVHTHAEGGDAVLRVRDSGYGIPRERLATLFELFTQVPEHHAKTGGGGLGIGLALSRQLVEMHEGAISVDSKGLGKGAEFVVRLPTATEHPEPAGESQGRPPTSERRRILIVEDNADAAESLRLLLELLGHTVEVANRGDTALQQMESARPDVMLLDVGLPDMGGLQVAERIRAMPDGARVIIIAVTGWGQEADVARTREAGFDDHLIKPVSQEAIEEKLAKWPARA